MKEDLWQTNLWMLFTPHLTFTSGSATECTVSKLETYADARNTTLGLSCINPNCFYTIIYLISMIDWHIFIQFYSTKRVLRALGSKDTHSVHDRWV